MLNIRKLTRFVLSAAVTAGLFCAGLAPARADVIVITLVVDENGNGTINGFTGLLPLPSSLITDSGPGGKAGVLAYNMQAPLGLVAGDVALREGPEVISDLIRFDPVTGLGTLFFYSDVDGGVDALADIGLPTGRLTNLVTLDEVSLGAQGFGAIYTPTAGQPGFVALADAPVSYTFISDVAAVPEPGSFLLLLPAALAVVLFRRRATAR